MDGKNKVIRSVSKYYFLSVDEDYQILSNCNETAYLINVKNNSNIYDVIRCARMLGSEYRLVLLSDKDSEYVCVVLYINICEVDDFELTMNWIKQNHKEWVVMCIDELPKDTNIVGKRVANTQFQANRLMLNGERLD